MLEIIDFHYCYIICIIFCSCAGLWGLVNNAGVLGYVCDGEILPIKLFKKYLYVNCVGSVEVTQVFLPLIRQSKGRIVSISSMAGKLHKYVQMYLLYVYLKRLDK